MKTTSCNNVETNLTKRHAAFTSESGGGAELGFRLTQCGLGRGLLPHLVASSSIQPFGHDKHGPKSEGCAPSKSGGLCPFKGGAEG